MFSHVFDSPICGIDAPIIPTKRLTLRFPCFLPEIIFARSYQTPYRKAFSLNNESNAPFRCTIASILVILRYRLAYYSAFYFRGQRTHPNEKMFRKPRSAAVTRARVRTHGASESEAPIQRHIARIRAHTTRPRGGSRRYEAAGTAHQ